MRVLFLRTNTGTADTSAPTVESLIVIVLSISNDLPIQVIVIWRAINQMDKVHASTKRYPKTQRVGYLCQWRRKWKDVELDTTGDGLAELRFKT